MGKYDRWERQEIAPVESKIHPVWRGIGCILLFLIPLLAYAAADTLFNDIRGLSVFGFNLLPSSGDLYHVYFSYSLLEDFTLRISLYHLVFTILFSVVGFMVFSMAYAIVYRFTGPPKYGPTDAPPPKRSKGKRRR